MKEFIVSENYIDGIYKDEGSTFGLDMQKRLIRCRNCQAWKGNECNLPEFGWCGCLQQLTHAGDYCAWSPNLDDEEEE